MYRFFTSFGSCNAQYSCFTCSGSCNIFVVTVPDHVMFITVALPVLDHVRFNTLPVSDYAMTNAVILPVQIM